MREARRTSCPRLSIWEDAVIDGLVRIEAGDHRTQGQAQVTLTPDGQAYLKRLNGHSVQRAQSA